MTTQRPSATNTSEPLFGNGALEDLRQSMRGDVLGPDDAEYDARRTVWNGMIDRRPAAIAHCLGPSDVIACVETARRHNMPISIRGGGHNIAGLAVSDDALMIDLSLMRGIRVDPSARTAHAQTGCLLSDVDRETQVHGLAAVLGFVSTTGAAGLTLGGGFGYLTRKYGWSCDNVRSMEVVTADARVVQASQEQNEDLFWGLRGGGGNFGVVTNIEYELHPVGPEILGGAIAWSWDDASDVLEAYDTFLRDAPPETVCVAALRMAPPAPWIDERVHGEPIVALFICHYGDIEEGEQLVASLRAIGSPVGDIVQRRSYVSQQSLIDATQPKGRRYYWKSDYLEGFETDMIAPLIKHAERVPSPHGAILLFPIGGALNRLPDDHGAVGNRDTRLILNIAAGWENPDRDAVNMEWTRTALRDFKEFATGGTYINFQTEDEGRSRIRDSYGDNYDRLVSVKKKWDPENLFRINRNIPPSE